MFGNPAFPSPPIDLNVFSAKVARFESLIVESGYGDKRVIVEKNKLREEIISMLRPLGHYAEHNSKNDMPTFLSSGFEPAPTTRVPAERPPQPLIAGIEQGLKGTLLVRITPLYRKARLYELRYAAHDANGIPTEPWTSGTLLQARTPAIISNLTPGTIYGFQVRAKNAAGYTDWCDSAFRMCI